MISRRQLGKGLAALFAFVFLYAYGDLLRPFVDEIGFWSAAPLLFIFALGLLKIILWIEDTVRGKARADVGLHNSFTQCGTVTVSDWDNALSANGETIDEAFRTAKLSEGQFFGGINDDADEVIAQWTSGGWIVSIKRPGVAKIDYIVHARSKLAGKTQDQSLWRNWLKGEPSEKLSEREARNIVRAFFGLEDKASGFARYTVDWTAT